MIQGVGIDIVEISRFQRAMDEWGDVFLKKIFTEKELAYARSKMHPSQHIAGRFAVKEAVSKALSTGWSGIFRWKDIEVENNAAGKPDLVLYGNMRELLKGSRVHISISHSENIVVALAIIEKL